MNKHPGGEDNTRRLIELAQLPAGASVLDMGAGAGAGVAPSATSKQKRPLKNRGKTKKGGMLWG